MPLSNLIIGYQSCNHRKMGRRFSLYRHTANSAIGRIRIRIRIRLSHRLLSEAVKAWTNIREQRPLKSLSTNPIIVGTLEGLSNAQPNLEIATIGLDELNKRRKPNAKNGIKAIDPKLSEIGHSTMPWLFKVSYNLLHLQKEHPPKKIYKTTLYVILRDGYTEQNGRYGLYIGETSKTAEDRFEEHKEGTRSARGLEEHGIQ